MLLYTLKAYKIETPFTFGNSEDLTKNAIIEKLLRGIGYVRARRSRDQSLQESYLTQALIREILQGSQNRLLILFQNDERMRSGRFNQPTMADISIEWLMQIFLSTMQAEGQNFHIIPVAINYDRLFEIRSLTEEIVSEHRQGQNLSQSILSLYRMIKSQTGQKMGRMYMTFGEAISMKDYLASKNMAPLE